MFTGIGEGMGTVREIRDLGGAYRLRVEVGKDLPVAIGDSVSVSGVCLTAVESGIGVLGFDVVPETVSRTSLAQLRVGDPVNIERSLKVGDPLGGHFVSGHVDAVGRLLDKRMVASGVTIRVEVEAPYTDYMIEKGSVAVDGISLTIAELRPPAFSVALIPHTLQKTTLGPKRVGDLVNVEVDMIGKWVRKLLGFPPAASGDKPGKIAGPDVRRIEFY